MGGCGSLQSRLQFVQELRALHRQKEKTRDKDGKKDIEQQIQFKSTGTNLAYSKMVRLRNNFTADVVCYMKCALVVFSGVCGEQSLIHCLCKGCSVCSVQLH